MHEPSLELVDRIRRLDHDALIEVYDRFSPGLYRYACRLLGDPCLAEDCVAETFDRFLQAVKRNAGPKDHLQAYLYRIAHNWSTDYYRNRANHPEIPIEDERKDLVFEETFQEDILEKQRLRAALFQLTSDQRTVLTLKFIEGWENEEIAATVKKPIGAVKALQHRALYAMRRMLSIGKEIKK